MFQSQDVDIITDLISKAILDAAEISIPNKIVSMRKWEGARWLTQNIRKLIRKKNRVHRKAKLYTNPSV